MRTLLRITKRGTVLVLSQTPPTKHVLESILRPCYRATRYGLLINIQLWGKTFWSVWEAEPLDKKLVWLFFLNQTIAVITLIELFTLRRR